MEKLSKLMKRSGAFCIAFGVFAIVAGITMGVLSIVNGGQLLAGKKLI